MNTNSDHSTSTVPSEGRKGLPPLPEPDGEWIGEWISPAGDAFQMYAGAKHSSETLTSYGNAVWRAAMLHAAEIAEKTWPRAHTYASENAHMYRAQDHVRDRITDAIRKEVTPPRTAAQLYRDE